MGQLAKRVANKTGQVGKRREKAGRAFWERAVAVQQYAGVAARCTLLGYCRIERLPYSVTRLQSAQEVQVVESFLKEEGLTYTFTEAV